MCRSLNLQSLNTCRPPQKQSSLLFHNTYSFIYLRTFNCYFHAPVKGPDRHSPNRAICEVFCFNLPSFLDFGIGTNKHDITHYFFFYFLIAKLPTHPRHIYTLKKEKKTNYKYIAHQQVKGQQVLIKFHIRKKKKKNSSALIFLLFDNI